MMLATKALRPRFRRGVALALVVVHATLVLAAWSIANRRTVDLLNLKQAVVTRERTRHPVSDHGQQLALSYALALLETGIPDSSPSSCYIDIVPDPEDPSTTVGYCLTFVAQQPHDPEKDKYSALWTVTATTWSPMGFAPRAELSLPPPDSLNPKRPREGD